MVADFITQKYDFLLKITILLFKILNEWSKCMRKSCSTC